MAVPTPVALLHESGLLSHLICGRARMEESDEGMQRAKHSVLDVTAVRGIAATVTVGGLYLATHSVTVTAVGTRASTLVTCWSMWMDRRQWRAPAQPDGLISWARRPSWRTGPGWRPCARRPGARASPSGRRAVVSKRCSYTGYMSAMREELHQLVDELPEAEVRPVLELIRGRADAAHGARDLPFFASFESDPDLAERSEEILRAELGR
jgi:hypothetical protein